MPAQRKMARVMLWALGQPHRLVRKRGVRRRAQLWADYDLHAVGIDRDQTQVVERVEVSPQG